MNSPAEFSDDSTDLDFPPIEWLVEVAEEEVTRCCKRLPLPLIEQARSLPVSFEDIPNEGILAEGFEPDLLGLFVGGSYADDAGSFDAPIPSQILLFLDNLWSFTEGDERAYRREVRKTYLHELGHYLGLDEDGLTQRGME